MPTDLGAHNPRLSAVVALQKRKSGWGDGRFAIEGPALLEAALAAGIPVAEIFVTAEGAGALVGRLETDGTPVFRVDAKTMRRISDLETPPGLVAVVDRPAEALDRLLEGDGAVLALAVSDPGNAGTLVRSAHAFGVGKIVFARGGVDPYHPKVVRAAMGSLFAARLALGTGAELSAAARRSGRPVIAADLDGEPLERFRFPDRPVIAIGHERHGIRGWLAERDGAVRIAQIGGESLNAGVAGSIVLYHYMLGSRGS